MTKHEMALFLSAAIFSVTQDIESDDCRDVPIFTRVDGSTLSITTERGKCFTVTVSIPRKEGRCGHTADAR
jgi:hypothetical protein